jgi:poly [ADP-ribose] polymerase 10/14/15
MMYLLVKVVINLRVFQTIKTTVTKCLELAENELPKYNNEGKSIAFPALGCGNLQYPPAVVAAAMFEAIMEYGNAHNKTTIADAAIILHKKDTLNYQVVYLIIIFFFTHL